MKSMLSSEALIKAHQCNRSCTAITQLHGSRYPSNPDAKVPPSKFHVNAIPLVAKNAEARNLDNLIQSFNNRVKDKPPFKQLFEQSKNQIVTSSTESFKDKHKKLPKHKSYLPPVVRPSEFNEQLPRTNQLYSFIRLPGFIPISHPEDEPMAPHTSFELIQRLQRAEQERLSSKEAASKVVYDTYGGAEESAKSIADLPYSELCAGKGASRRRTAKKEYVKYLNPSNKQRGETLVFESRFESGNLRRAVQV
eukprot:TRINITY_DN4709_c0_g1_i12.p2 TRINITY_DN4709_c0_g1~~TRINITY_DN4709_c0_g1_i12.p2  ORF type:complete len:251 (+),score=35.67 TRINITY_DN4709_c0_g1_i12:49-801(+)